MLPAISRCCRRSPIVYARWYASSAKGPNHDLIEILEREMYEHSQSPDKNNFKLGAFSRAIKAINSLQTRITSIDDVQDLAGVGIGMQRRVSEFLSSSVSVSTQVLLQVSEKRRKALAELQLVTGIGPVKAQQLVDAGCMSIAQLREPQFYDTLKPAQRLSLTFLEHIEQPVTREQAESVVSFMRETISKEFEIHLVGSYRRGLPTSSDIDILLFHPTYTTLPLPKPVPDPHTFTFHRSKASAKSKSSKSDADPSSLLQDGVLAPLESEGILSKELSLSKGERKFQGIARVPGSEEEREGRLEGLRGVKGVFRRIDLNLLPTPSKPGALISLTGDTEFNRDLRSRAQKLAMHLNEFGLWRWEEAEGEGEEGGRWEMVEAESEEKVLEVLGVGWVEPTKRNFNFLKVRRGRKGT